MSSYCSHTRIFFFINDFWCVYSEVVDKAGVDPLITLLNDAKPLVQANAAVCLTNLATEGTCNPVTLPQRYDQFILLLIRTLFIFLEKAIWNTSSKPWLGFCAFCPALGIWWVSVFAFLAFPALGSICIFSRLWSWQYVFPRIVRVFVGLLPCLRLFWLVRCEFQL